MKELSLKQILLNHLNSTSGWVSKGELGIVTEREGYLPESCGRHLREMAEKGEINVSYYKGKRNQTLARYSRLGELPPVPSKPQVIIEMVNGQPTAKLISYEITYA